MSYMIVKCSWCGETYDFGVVGSEIVGSGHRCQAARECDTEGCTERGRFLVARGLPVEDQAFSCALHIGGGTILSVQPGRA